MLQYFREHAFYTCPKEVGHDGSQRHTLYLDHLDYEAAGRRERLPLGRVVQEPLRKVREGGISDFDSVGWNMRHTQALMELADRLEAGGCEVFIEDQNRFRVSGRESGSVMSGKPDLIALHPDGRATVYDVKTGREVDSHEAQVKLYMYLLPRARGTRWHGRTFDGCVVHGDGSEIPIPATAIDDEFRGMVSNLMRRVVSDTPARRVPSPHECGYCVLTSEDCPERIESEVA